MSDAIAAAADEVEGSRGAAREAFEAWTRAESQALRAWAMEQGRKFVTIQHEVSQQIGSDGVQAFREDYSAAVAQLATDLPAALAELWSENGSVHKTSFSQQASARRELCVAPLGELLQRRGYECNRRNRPVDWYVGDLQETVGHGGITFEDPEAAAALRRYFQACEHLKRANQALQGAREAQARAAASELWGE